METTIDRQELIQLIHAHLDIAPDNVLEEVLELLEDEKDLRDYELAKEDIRKNGTVSWEEYKRETA
jgi:lipase chaperone LimK